MSLNINNPPPGVVVSPNPITKELGDRSQNILPTPKKLVRSLDGRQLITPINDYRFTQNEARNILADRFPSGLDSSIDAAQSPGAGAAPVASISADISSIYADAYSSGSSTATSQTRTLTVPASSTGQILLQQNNSARTTQYQKNGGVWTTFTNNTLITIANGDTLAFRSTNLSPGNAVNVTVSDYVTTQVIISGALENTYTKDPTDPYFGL